jgi:hypothetical protein
MAPDGALANPRRVPAPRRGRAARPPEIDADGIVDL